jgi:S1-C subfamily serine protease
MIRRMAIRAVTVAGCLGSAAAALALPASLVDRAERATALVDVNTSEGRAFGSAFCISDRGLFATDGHVVLGSTGEIKLIIRPGEKDQRVSTAHVLGFDYDADLAVVQPDSPGDVPTLTLGNSDLVLPTQEVTAFGYPFGNMLALDKDAYPSITVNSGKVTALRKEKGELALIQVDALVNPGNSGGPVMDSAGKVIGLVESGVPGAGLNFATPVARLKKMLDGPLVVIDPSTVEYSQRDRKQTFSIRVSSMSQSKQEYDLDFKIVDAKGEAQTASGKTTGGKCDLQLTPTMNDRPIKWNPFEDPPPTFKFVLTLKHSQQVVRTEEGKIVIINVPVDGQFGRVGGKHKGGGAGEGGARSGGGAKQITLDPLPADALDTELIGSEKSAEFREVSPAEALAVGVQYTVAETNGQPVIGDIRLAHTKAGTATGQSIIAKEGYVVGGLMAEAHQYGAGQYFSGFKVIFIRQKAGKLDPSDTYFSDWIGRPPKGKPKQLAGKGERVIGLCGHRGTYIRGIGLVIQKPAALPSTQPAAK